MNKTILSLACVTVLSQTLSFGSHADVEVRQEALQ